MSDATQLSMRDARDAEDKRLLENGEIQLLLAGWVETIRDTCIAKMRGPVGEDVARPCASGCGASSRPAGTATAATRSGSLSTR